MNVTKLFSDAAEYPLTDVDVARIIAQTHDAMQHGEPSVCPFAYDDNAHVWCDGQEYTIEQFMNMPNIWGWLMAMDPIATADAVNTIRDSRIDGLCEWSMTALLIVTLYERLHEAGLTTGCSM